MGDIGYDPKLKTAIGEIQQILEKHDVSGVIQLISQTHSEFLIHFPTWSGVQFEESTDGEMRLRIKFKKEDIEKGNLTAHLIVDQMQMSSKHFEVFSGLFQTLKTKCLISFSSLESRFRPAQADDERG